MKKLLMALAFAGVALGANAQDADPALKYSVATNSFWSNWFVQGNLAGSAFWGNQEVGNDFAKSPFEGFRNNLGFSVAVGKWFTPGLGLRTKFMIIRNYAKDTDGLFARIIGKISALTILQYINYKNEKPIGRVKYALF